MSTIRVKQGDVTITLTGPSDDWIRRATTAAGGAVLRAVREEAQAVATAASGHWYEMVNKRTGLSGQLGVMETVDINAATVTVSVGSTDNRIAGKKNAPVPRLVSTAGPDSVILVTVTQKEYYDTPKRLRYKYPQVFQTNPKATSARRSLLKLLVIDPMTAGVHRRIGEIEQRVAAAVERA